MNLLYDNLIYCLQNVGGISVYWYELTQRLLKEPNVNLKFYETGLEIDNLLRARLDIKQDQVVISNRVNLLIERFLKLPKVDDDNIFHSSYFRTPVYSKKTKVVSTIHDFTHDLYYSGPRVYLHNKVKKKAIESSDLIITVSENTRKDLLQFYPKINKDIVKTVYNGVSEQFKIIEELKKTEITPYFLYIGSREHYKNFEFALELTSRYKDFSLYIVGSALNKKEEKLVYSYLGNRYKIHKGISTVELNQLYNQAFCLLYPSYYEGFGIPLVEAMRAGCPFIALNASSIPEVSGNAGILLEELNLDEGIAAIESMFKNRSELIVAGIKQSQKFSWDLCYNQTYNHYKSLI